MAEAQKALVGAIRLRNFRTLVVRHYRRAGRHTLPWRQTRDPYRILISELMLQQTQVARVIPKYREFIRRFPNFRALARAPLADVLRVWQGLGYNRRALYLKRIAERVVEEYDSMLPCDPHILTTFPGIGPNTAGSIAAFAFNAPVVFIETNIRRTFIHHFFPRRRAVSDTDIMPLIAATLRHGSGPRNLGPREWYSALMDYGAHLGEVLPKPANPNRRSTHYVRQAALKGSIRELRGMLVKLLLRQPMNAKMIRTAISDTRVSRVLSMLLQEGFIAHRAGKYHITRQ